MFSTKPYTIVHSVVQRSLLKWWDDLRGPQSAPPRSTIDPNRLARYWNEVILHEVVRETTPPRFRIRFHGKDLLLLEGADRCDRYLDEVLPDSIRESVLAGYHALLDLKRPIYSVRPATDANGTSVTFERLLLPFNGGDGEVAVVLAHVQTFCPDGRYERSQLFEASMKFQRYRVQAALVPPDRPAPPRT